ncbi:MAG: type VI secretion protein IcmF/TssM N-terminal domain-containing protein [Phycisphaerae bacterium]
MSALKDSFANLPTPMKGAFAFLFAGCLMSMVYAYTSDRRVVIILACGLVLVALLLIGYRALLAKLRKGKAAPMEKGILGNTAATPQGISAPAKRASIDDLRKKFEAGITTFKSVGKDLYSLPWYIIVGEPGAGKTEAIRHCNVGFPPGLQDQFQGAGGTINMNWWFTNHAVMLDTAGRLMFEEVQPGQTSEWNEFLRLLVTHRPNCPINGMILVIPADSLIRDTADQIEAKGARIANQLDNIQRLLGVRFPVFVVVTKCDLINGFREFFDQLNDPQSQHQMMGWSNPAPLDEPFDPAQVDQHLKTVVARLERRRLRLLLDPVNTQDPAASRTPQVDALYALPQALLRVVPRLRRYLEMVFVAGEWSAKPLFLRGIYFTSSMREGAALDQDLAEALGVPVESLPEGKVWERDRAYFLRDLFMEKVFKEKGLVTRARNAAQLKRRRRLAVLITGFVSVLVLAGLTWWGGMTLRDSVGRNRDYWVAAADNASWPGGAGDYWRPVVQKDVGEYKYAGAVPLKVGRNDVRTDQFQDDLAEQARHPVRVPWIFSFASRISGDIQSKQLHAQRVVYEHGVLWPLVDAARAKMTAQKDTDPWTPDATAALVQLIRIEANTGRVKAKEGPRFVDVGDLTRYVLGKSDFRPYKAGDKTVLQAVEEATYSPGGSMGKWPEGFLAAGGAESDKAIRNGIELFIRSLSPDSRNSRVGTILAANDALKKFDDEEAKLLQVNAGYPPDKGPDTIQATQEPKKNWTDRFAAVAAAKEAVDKYMAGLSDKPLALAYSEAINELVNQTVKDCDVIQKETGAPSAAEDPSSVLPWARSRLAAASESLRGRFRDSKIEEELKKHDAEDLAAVANDRLRVYAKRFGMYQLADTRMTASAPAVTLETFADRIAETKTAIKDARGEIDKTALVLGNAYRAEPAANVSRFALRMTEGERYNRILNDALEALPSSPEKVAARVKEQAKPGKPPPTVPLTSISSATPFDARYNGDGARAIIAQFKQLGDMLADANLLVIDRPALTDSYKGHALPMNAYMQFYLDYWTKTVPESLKIKPMAWAEMHKEMGELRVTDVHEGLDEFCKRLSEALPKPEEVADDALKRRIVAAQAMIQATQRQTSADAFRSDAKDVVAAWADLRKEATAAKDTIGALKPAAFLRKYIILVPLSTPDYASAYWENLTTDALGALADEAQVDIAKALEQLKKSARFPLVKYKKDEQEMTGAEVDDARKAVTSIAGRAADISSRDADSIARGGETGNAKIDRNLRRLRGMELAEADRTWLSRLKKVADALPGPNATFTCKISILPMSEQDKDKDNALAIWADVSLAQGKAKPVRLQTVEKDLTLLSGVAYPGDDLAFCFFKHPIDTEPSTTVKVPGPWSAIRLIHLLALGESADGKTWTVRLGLEDDQKNVRPFRIKLEFEKELPAMAEWPDRMN